MQLPRRPGAYCKDVISRVSLPTLGRSTASVECMCTEWQMLSDWHCNAACMNPAVCCYVRMGRRRPHWCSWREVATLLKVQARHTINSVTTSHAASSPAMPAGLWRAVGVWAASPAAATIAHPLAATIADGPRVTALPRTTRGRAARAALQAALTGLVLGLPRCVRWVTSWMHVRSSRR